MISVANALRVLVFPTTLVDVIYKTEFKYFYRVLKELNLLKFRYCTLKEIYRYLANGLFPDQKRDFSLVLCMYTRWGKGEGGQFFVAYMT